MMLLSSDAAMRLMKQAQTVNCFAGGLSIVCVADQVAGHDGRVS